MRKHAILSASSAERWLNCTQSARLAEKVRQEGEDGATVYAQEGTLAHGLAEALLLDDKTTVGKIKKDPLFYPAMVEEVEEYVDFCKEEFLGLKSRDKNSFYKVEERLDFSKYVPEGFGTGDFVMIGDNAIHVVDLKFGKGVEVYPDNNPQLMLYGLGALSDYGFLWDVEKITLTIAQVRLGNIASWEISAEQLINWGEAVVKPKARLAFKGEGDILPGSWCRWCPYGVLCKARADQFLNVFERHKEIEALKAGDIGDILNLSRDLKNWLSDLEDFAVKELMAGTTIPGFKLVEGRSMRKITDEEGFAKVLLQELPEDKVYKPRAIQTITFLEKQIGKKRFAELGSGFIEKPQGRPTLAAADDKRPAMFGAESDFTFDK